MSKLTILLVVILMIAVGCSSEKGVLISNAEYGNDWPYSISEGRLYCDPPGSSVVLQYENKVYALNGRAMGKANKRGYIIARDTITLKDKNGFFTIGNSGAIIKRGLEMCSN